MDNNIKINDESGDHKYFSLLPHYILNHSTAIDQALYMQMKRYAGEDSSGTCWASKKTLKEKLGIGHKALNKSIEYLIGRGWIIYLGKRKIKTIGGEQLVDEYSIKDIWKENVLYYEQGCSESIPLPESSVRVSQKEDKGGCFGDTNKNHILNKNNKEDTLQQLFEKEIQTDNLKEKENFLSYWTEKNTGGKKERWQKQTVFDIKRRWSTWLKNSKKWSNDNKQGEWGESVSDLDLDYYKKQTEKWKQRNHIV